MYYLQKKWSEEERKIKRKSACNNTAIETKDKYNGRK
jgi:hypothetical protein